MKHLILTLSLLILLSPIVSAKGGHHEETHHDHSAHHHPEVVPLSESSQAYIKANNAMHTAMNIDFTGDPDVDFLRGMIPHHQGAVDMANVQLKYGGSGLLKAFTGRIIRDQKREILFMKRNLETLEVSLGSKTKNHRSTTAFKRVNRHMHREMNIAFSDQADSDFIRGMIPHHQGAVEMARVVLAYGKDPFARRLAHNIINAQQSEISWMKRWLSRKRLMKLF